MKSLDNKLYKVFFWLVVASFLTPLIYSTAFYVPFTTSKTFFFYIVIELALPIYLYLCWRYFGFGHLKNPIVYLSAAFLGLSLLSSVLGVNFLNSFWGNFERMQGLYLAIHMFLWMLYLVLIFKTDRNKIDWLLNTFIVVGAILGLHGILQQMGIGTIASDTPTRSVSVFGNPIFFSAFLIIPFFLSLYQFEKTNRNYWFLGFAALILGGILSTKTIGADVGLAAGLGLGAIIYFWLARNTKALTATLIAIVILGGATAFGISKSATLRDRFLGSDAIQRLIEWKIALTGFKEKPIFGVGPENYSYLSNKYIDDRIYTYSNGFFDKPHNYFLEVLDTRGLVGLAVYLGGIGFVGLGLWMLYKKNQISLFGLAALTGGLVAYLVQNFFAFDMITALMGLTLLYALSSLAWVTPETQVAYKKYLANASFAAAAVLILYLMGINITTAKANIYLADALKFTKSNAILPPGYYEHLATFPAYADPSEIAIQYERYVNSLAEQFNVNKDVTLDLVQQQITSAIAANKKVVDRNSYYFPNFVSLGNLYVLKSEVDGQIDPSLNSLTDKMDKLAPKRIESNFALIAIYAYQGDADKAQTVMTGLNKKAPDSPQVMWEQVYVDAVGHKAELVLTETKALISKNLDNNSISELDRVAAYYINLANYRQAEALYSTAITIYPSNGHFYVQLARAYVTAGDQTTARQVIETLKKQYPDSYNKYKSQIDQFLK